jgi:hypothetical protein
MSNELIKVRYSNNQAYIRYFNNNAYLLKTESETVNNGAGVTVVASASEINICDQTSFYNTIPSATMQGDLIVALIFARSPIVNSSGFNLLASESIPGTATGQYTAIYTKTASSSDANSTLTFTTQSASTRSSMSIIVLRASVGSVILDNFDKNGSDTDYPGLPTVNVSSQNSVAVAVFSNTLVYNIGDPATCSQYPTSITGPNTYTKITNSTSNACISCNNARLWAGYQVLDNVYQTNSFDRFNSENVDPPRVSQILAVFKDSSAEPTSASPVNLSRIYSIPLQTSVSGDGSLLNPINGFVSGSDYADNNLYLIANISGTLYYNFTVSSEPVWDIGYFYVNNVLIFQISGSTNRTGSISISSGQEVRIRYTKDGEASDGQNKLIINSLYIQ